MQISLAILVAPSLVLASIAAGCGGTAKPTGSGGTGGASATGGGHGSGGALGSGGGIATGGALATGGNVGSGGLLASGGFSGSGGGGRAGSPGGGGTTATGGAGSGTGGGGGRATNTTASGGGTAGGSASSGGAAGGARSTGGVTGAGGTATTGGSHGTGGTPGTGGSHATGGAPGTGGSSAAGGTSGSGGIVGVDAGPSDAPMTSDASAAAAIPVGHCGARSGRYFPASSWIYTDVSDAPMRDNSAATTAWLENAGGWGNSNRFQIDVSFVILDADASTPRVARTATDPIDYSGDCDPDVSMPIPTGGHIEGEPGYVCGDRANGSPDGDCHLLVADFSSNTLFEAYQATYTQGLFYTSCTVAWSMARDVWGAPPATGSPLPAVSTRNWGIGRGCTGPDAAGFPIAPLLFTIGDIQSGKVEHAIRFALPNNRMQKAASAGARSPVFVWPATHAGGPSAVSPDAPIYGSRWRLKPGFDAAARGLDPANPVVKAVVYGLRHYGMLIADGGDIALMAEDGTGCSQGWDDLWGPNGSRVLSSIRPSDFDVLDTGGTDAGWDCVRNAR